MVQIKGPVLSYLSENDSATFTELMEVVNHHSVQGFRSGLANMVKSCLIELDESCPARYEITIQGIKSLEEIELRQRKREESSKTTPGVLPYQGDRVACITGRSHDWARAS